MAVTAGQVFEMISYLSLLVPSFFALKRRLYGQVFIYVYTIVVFMIFYLRNSIGLGHMENALSFFSYYILSLAYASTIMHSTVMSSDKLNSVVTIFGIINIFTMYEKDPSTFSTFCFIIGSAATIVFFLNFITTVKNRRLHPEPEHYAKAIVPGLIFGLICIAIRFKWRYSYNEHICQVFFFILSSVSFSFFLQKSKAQEAKSADIDKSQLGVDPMSEIVIAGLCCC